MCCDCQSHISIPASFMSSRPLTCDRSPRVSFNSFFVFNTAKEKLAIFPHPFPFQPSPSQSMTPPFTQFPKLEAQESLLILYPPYVPHGLSHQVLFFFLFFSIIKCLMGPFISVSTTMIIIAIIFSYLGNCYSLPSDLFAANLPSFPSAVCRT